MQDATIFLVDDDPSVRKALTRLIRSVGYPVESFSSAQEFLNHDHNQDLGCLLLDVQMPGISGMQLQEELVLAGKPIPIIFISGHGTIPMSVRAMKTGAVDFLTKPFKEDQLLSAIRNAIEKGIKRRSELSQIHGIQVRMNTLTARELEVFSLVVQGLLNKQIAAELGISEKTVKVHRSRVMDKMRAGSLAELVTYAQIAGLSAPHVTE